ncbi:MAG: hypothetical protein ACKOOC_04650, partial [Cyanobium sp.]
MTPANAALVEVPLRWPVPLAAVLLSAGAWVGLDLLASRFPRGSTARLLLRRARLSLALTLLVAGLVGWLHGQLLQQGALQAQEGPHQPQREQGIPHPRPVAGQIPSQLLKLA